MTLTFISSALLQAEMPSRSAAESMQRLDPHGIGMTILGYSVVLIVLTLVYVVFLALGKSILYRNKLKMVRSGKIAVKEEAPVPMTGELNAAIATALYLYVRDVHDFETTVLTIKRVSRPYSPWSSKIYGLRPYPKKGGSV